jgi:hypothetical protein
VKKRKKNEAIDQEAEVDTVETEQVAKENCQMIAAIVS